MKIPELNHGERLVGDDGKPASFGVRLISAVNLLIGRTGGIGGQALGPLQSYTVAQLTVSATSGYLDPTAYAQQMVYVSNGTANKRLAVSDGTNWRFPDGAIVS